MSETTLAADAFADEILKSVRFDAAGGCIETKAMIRTQIKVAYLAGYADALQYARRQKGLSMVEELTRRKHA